MARNAKVAEAKAEMEEEIEQYNLTVMTAVQEVNNAMVSWQSVCDQGVYQEILLKDARRELELQVDRYKQGLLDFSDVADAETTVLQYENAVVQSHAAQLAALVTLYTALGGGY
jgi:outer membrane protein TolC